MRRPSASLPRICRSVKIASTEERITTGYRRRVRIAEVAVRTARFVLKNINTVGSAAVPISRLQLWEVCAAERQAEAFQ
jgi:hypothetical protein